MDRLSEFKLNTGDEIKADSNCAASGCLSCNAFVIATFSSVLLILCHLA